MKLFSIDERELIKTQIIDIAEKNENILSAVLVGSGAVGFTDDISDLDFYLIVNHDENIIEVMKYMREHIEKSNESIFFEQMSERKLQIYLLQNYLEIDIGYSSIDEAEADMERFKVMFDKTCTANRQLNETWQKYKEINQIIDVRNKYQKYAVDTWHFLFHAATALKRGQYWRCAAEMEIARSRIIEIKGYKYSLATKRWRDVDKFPPKELANIQKTLVTEFTQEALLKNLLCLVDLIYDELEEHFHDDIAVKRKHVTEYITSTIKIK